MIENKETKQCAIPISGSIFIEKNNDKGQLKLVSNSNWFDSEYVIVSIDEDCIIINKPTLDYRGRMFKVMNIGLNSVVKLSLELPMGKFEFDTDESTEDELVVYCR